jgi:hypothetical protein
MGLDSQTNTSKQQSHHYLVTHKYCNALAEIVIEGVRALPPVTFMLLNTGGRLQTLLTERRPTYLDKPILLSVQMLRLTAIKVSFLAYFPLKYEREAYEITMLSVFSPLITFELIIKLSLNLT